MTKKSTLAQTGGENHDDHGGNASIRLGFLFNSRENLANSLRSSVLQENDQNGNKPDLVDEIISSAVLQSRGSTSLNDIIKSMVKAVYGSARLSLPEFIERFKRDKIAELIVDNFEKDLVALDNTFMETDSDEDLSAENIEALEAEVGEYALRFLIEKGLTSAETLYSCLAQKKDEWRMINLQRIYVSPRTAKNTGDKTKPISLKERLVKVIYDSLAAIAAQAYEEKFNEDKRGFVMGFMMGRVIKIDLEKRKMTFDPVEFDNLMTYLDSIGYSVAKLEGKSLYEMLYDESREMAGYIQEQKIMCLRFGVRNKIVAAMEILPEDQGADKLFFEDGFNVKAFYDKYIRMAIFRFYSKKLSKLGMVREVDLFHKLLDPENQGRTNYTIQMVRYVQNLVKMSREAPEVFMMKLRELLGLEKSPLYEDLTDEVVFTQLRFFLRQSEAKFRRTMVDALFYRQDPEIHAACSYPEPILSCDNVADLLEWFVEPDAFKKKYPEYQATPDDQIVYMCSSFLRGFIYTMQEMSNKEFMEADIWRDLLEKKDKEELEIKEIEKLDLKFKVLQEIDKDGVVPHKPKLELALDTRNLGQFTKGTEVEEHVDADLSGLVMGNNNLLQIEWQGRLFRVLPREMKNFTLVEMLVPVDHVDERGKQVVEKVRIRVLIYTGDSHYIHVKDPLTRVTSQERGKQISDVCREMMVFSSLADLRVFKNWVYRKIGKGLIKVEDPEENRFISNKRGKALRTKSTEDFKKGQKFSCAAYYFIPIKGLDGKMQVIKAILERQCWELKPLLLDNLSEFTDTSHDVYRAQRAWALLEQYFPPDIFGDKFRKFQNEGYRK